MLPIKDTIRSRTFPVVNWLLVVINVLVFLLEISLSPRELQDFIQNFGLVPARLDPVNPLTWYPVITHMFLHGGWFHLLSNLWIFLIFADNVEDRMGAGRFLVFYLLGGIAAGLIQGLVTMDAVTPSIGASGAVAAVLGAYILYYPHARVITMFLLFIIPWFVELPAVLYLGVWFASQLFSGVASLTAQSGAWGGVAWWAHIGGFLFGLVMARIFVAGRREPRWYPDEYFPY